jgi:ubiquinone/menaquinone biosynthesis C-methylase UbiE
MPSTTTDQSGAPRFDPPAHRAFAAFWQWQTSHQGARERALRREVASRATGRVLELGVGVGTNWEHLPDGVDYVGIEPDPYMLDRAQKHAKTIGRTWAVEPAAAEDLPFEAETFDTVLVTLTLCTVAEQAVALSEALRVLKPGGKLLFLEHVLPEGRVKSRLAGAITPLWRRVGAGCHPNRRTLDSIRAAGFEVTELRRLRMKGLPIVAGTALKPIAE